VARQVESDPKAAAQVAAILEKLVRAYWESDCSLAEINPLVVTPEGKVLALDAKMVLDDNALYRRSDLEAYREEEEPNDQLAREKGLSFVLDGDQLTIRVTNFLDIGGSSNPEKVTAAMRIITSDPKVKAIFFNIFGGITRCDDVARGIVEALSKNPLRVPLVVRLTGTNEEEGREILRQAAGVIPAATMDEGAQRVIAEAKKGGRA
jgi:succinyl-CoA synthetase beta subunit